MEPIISPYYFYIVSLCDKSLYGIITSIVFLLFGGSFFIIFELESGHRYNGMLKLMKFIAILLFVWVIIPSSMTCHKMLIASFVTPNNIEIVGEKTEKAIDKLIDKIASAAKELENGQDNTKDKAVKADRQN